MNKTTPTAGPADMGNSIELIKDAYSPTTLAKELAPLVSLSVIRKQIKLGLLKAYRLGGRNIIIFKKDIEEWFRNLRPATEPTKYDKKVRRVKTASELADYVLEQQRRRKARRGK